MFSSLLFSSLQAFKNARVKSNMKRSEAETAKQTADETKAIFFDLLKQATGEDEKTHNMLEH